ncbi:hypothetical protein ABIB90_008250, partial [Bradyrhizobium sp. JR4.1]|uniref:hypothetical protein n=1 Tax=Bradyrhizobium sp. JR4.1 TaxID=3156372 RepID=UPI0033986C45
FVCHHKVSTYFGGHLMHQSTQKQKVQGNSRLLSICARLRIFGVDRNVGAPQARRSASLIRARSSSNSESRELSSFNRWAKRRPRELFINASNTKQ